jgi:hypothetical protein
MMLKFRVFSLLIQFHFHGYLNRDGYWIHDGFDLFHLYKMFRFNFIGFDLMLLFLLFQQEWLKLQSILAILSDYCSLLVLMGGSDVPNLLGDVPAFPLLLPILASVFVTLVFSERD